MVEPGNTPDSVARYPKGMLLVLPPGVGKTFLARAVAAKQKVPFFSMGASELAEMVVGVGVGGTSAGLFKRARTAATAMIFIDELDAIGRARGSSLSCGTNSGHERTLNQILTRTDGFSSGEAVIVLAAKNRSDVLDHASLQPGRFDGRVIVQPPDETGRTGNPEVPHPEGAAGIGRGPCAGRLRHTGPRRRLDHRSRRLR